MSFHVFIDGDQGTTGLQIRDRLADRRDVELLTLPESQRKNARAREEALNACDVAILCLPDAAAREAVAMVRNPRVRVIDASSAHRTEAGWIYGFPELAAGQAERIAAAQRVTNPGCYPTGALALLKPLVSAGLLPAGYPISVHAVSGYSGRGRAGVDAYEQAAPGAAAPAFQVYGLSLDHKHVPEIEKHAGLQSRPIFVPAYGAFRQGIVVTIPLHLRLMQGANAASVHACLERHFEGSRHVHVTPLAETAGIEHLDPQALNGTDDLRLSVFTHPSHGQVLLTAVFDNLGKGAAGAAVQNLDLMLSGAGVDSPSTRAR